MSHIQCATVDDYESLLATMNQAFRVADPSFVSFHALLPDLYQPTEACMSCHRIIRDDNIITASAGIYPVSLRMGEIELMVAGIGGVATHPDHRGRGCMTAIMQAICSELSASGYALSWLSGDRTRYSRFGWETAGSSLFLNLTHPGSLVDPGPWEILPVDLNADGIAPFFSAYNHLAVRGVCNQADMLLKLKRHGVSLFTASSSDKVAYVAVNKQDHEFCEWTGHPDGVQALMCHTMKDKKTWKARLSIIRDAYTDMLLDMAAHIGHVYENLAILNLEQLFRIYEPWLTDHWPENICVKFVLHPVRGEAQTVYIKQGHVISPTEKIDTCIELRALPMVRLLFGPVPAILCYADPLMSALQQAFPLPFHMPQLWHV